VSGLCARSVVFIGVILARVVPTAAEQVGEVAELFGLESFAGKRILLVL